jgi:adenylosuccinate lyase
VIPDAFLALDYMLDRFTWLVDGLVVDEGRMRANLDGSGGLVYSQRVLSALVAAGHPRDEAYRLVQRNALRAWDEGVSFRELVAADPEIDLDAAALDEAFDPEAAVRHVDALFERLASLTRQEEPIHA